jgi:hypothetical protein
MIYTDVVVSSFRCSLHLPRLIFAHQLVTVVEEDAILTAAGFESKKAAHTSHKSSSTPSELQFQTPDHKGYISVHAEGP